MKVPTRTDRDAVADWAEASCLFQYDGFLSRSEVERVLEDEEVSGVESIVENAWMEIGHRHDSCEITHPIVASAEALSSAKRWEDVCAYAFQLLLACASYYSERELGLTKPQRTVIAKLFERLTTHAMERYIGGRAVNVGFPRRGDIPRGFSACIDYVCEQAMEMRGDVKRFSSDTKDEDVDIVAWRSFEDRRPSQVMIFLQCATGRHWKDKATDLSLDEWRSCIAWAAPPLRGFAFPFVCSDRAEWRRLSGQGGVLLDRLRIASLVRDDPRLDSELRQCCTDLVEHLE